MDRREDNGLDFEEIRKLNNLPQISSRVVVAMSGGVDSSVIGIITPCRCEIGGNNEALEKKVEQKPRLWC